MTAFSDAKRYQYERGWSARSMDADEIIDNLVRSHAELIKMFKPDTPVELAQANMRIVSLEADLSDIRSKYRRAKQELVKSHEEINEAHQLCSRLRSRLDAQSQTSVIPNSRGESGASMSSEPDVETR